MTRLTQDMASHFARTALGHVTREWPNKLDHVMTGEDDVKSPRALHPIFYGSFDWHSSVHAHWLLARLYRRFPDLPEAPRIREFLNAQFVDENISGEFDYLHRPSSRGFERPYGWAWLLMLRGELARHESSEGRDWATAIEPLSRAIQGRFDVWIVRATYPVRAGVHSNTAFALLLALDYAKALGDSRFAKACRHKALLWYGRDAACQAWEPGGDEFLSPALIEAACMSKVLDRKDFTAWFSRFLPHAAQGEPATLFEPAIVSDRTDGKIAHLDGLNLSRAWCWRLIADASDHAALRKRTDATIATHLDSALAHVTGDYMGEHWLASFALLALDNV